MTTRIRPLIRHLIFIVVGLAGNAYAQQADLVLRGGSIWTVDAQQPQAEAVAVRDGRIVFVGSDDGVADYVDPATTRVLDLDGAFVMPGFNDNHVHAEWTGRVVYGLNLLDVQDEKTLLQKVREIDARFAPNVWITGGQWSAYEAWEEGTTTTEGRKASGNFFKPHRNMIDRDTPNRPVFVSRFDGAVHLANGKALELAGIASGVSDPPGISVERDAQGEPTGILTGSGVLDFFTAIIPPRSWEQRIRETQEVLDRCRRFGVTSISDMSDPTQRALFYHFRNEGKLTVRVESRAYLDQWEHLAALGIKIGAGDEMIRLGALKKQADGNMGDNTARFFEDYSHMPGERGRWEPIMYPWYRGEGNQALVSNMERAALGADAAGIQLSIHAIGDQANDYVLGMIERLIDRNGTKDRRFRLVHAQVLRRQDLERFRDLGVVAEVQPYHLADDMRWMEERIGNERSRGAYAFRSLWDSGAVVSFGTDSPGTNQSRYPFDPMPGLYAAVTRQTLTGEPVGGWFPDEKLSMAEAIQAYTLNSAYATFEEDIKGSISVGKLADIVVLSENLFEIDPARVKDVEVVTTVFNGKVVFQR